MRVGHNSGNLEAIHKGFDLMADTLQRGLCVPLCIPGCGECCKHNTPVAWEQEAAYVLHKLRGSKSLSMVMELSWNWLMQHVQGVTTTGHVGEIKDAELMENLKHEVRVLMSQPCPFLMQDATCMIYPARPLTCRAFGVTRVVSSDMCKRPLAQGETYYHRAFVGGGAANKMRQVIDLWRVTDNVTMEGFLPTMIVGLVDRPRLERAIKAGEIEDAKIMASAMTQALLFQADVEDLLKHEQLLVV